MFTVEEITYNSEKPHVLTIIVFKEEFGKLIGLRSECIQQNVIDIIKQSYDKIKNIPADDTISLFRELIGERLFNKGYITLSVNKILNRQNLEIFRH